MLEYTLNGVFFTAGMRKPGRVLFSLRTIRAIAAPSTLSSSDRAENRYAIRRAITSAVEDMQYIYEKADDATRERLTVEIERLITAMYMEPGKTPRFAAMPRAGAGPQDLGGGPEQETKTRASKEARDFESSLR